MPLIMQTIWCNIITIITVIIRHLFLDGGYIYLGVDYMRMMRMMMVMVMMVEVMDIIGT